MKIGKRDLYEILKVLSNETNLIFIANIILIAIQLRYVDTL
jgi:hypothetical protein